MLTTRTVLTSYPHILFSTKGHVLETVTTSIRCSSSSLQIDNIRCKTLMFRVLSSDCEAKFLFVSMPTGYSGHLYSYLKRIFDPH
jgi:hypothetical protein